MNKEHTTPTATLTGEFSLSTKQRNHITQLDKLYFSPPFNGVEVREDKTNPLLEMMIMNSSPGILDKDIYKVDIQVVDNTQLSLQSQSYQRIYNSPNGTEQHTYITLGENAYFSFTPHPNVPCKDSNFYGLTRIDMSECGELLYADIVACGRKQMETNEIFSFGSYQSVTELYIKSKLFLKDNLYLNPQQIPPNQIGLYENFTHQLNLIYYNSQPQIIDQDIILMNDKLTKEKNIMFGITKKGNHCFIIRLLGEDSETLFRIASGFRKEKDDNQSVRHTTMINKEL